MPDRGLVLAIHANGGHASAFIDEVLAEILSSAAGIRLPSRVLPPDTPVPFRPDCPLRDRTRLPGRRARSVGLRPDRSWNAS